MLILMFVSLCCSAHSQDYRAAQAGWSGDDPGNITDQVFFQSSQMSLSVNEKKKQFFLNSRLPRLHSLSVEIVTTSDGSISHWLTLFHGDNVSLPASPDNQTHPSPVRVVVRGLRPVQGLVLALNCTYLGCLGSPNISHLRLDIVRSEPLMTLVTLVGWVYFLAWTVSFYPQMFVNARKRSVVGLDFNFLALNFLGFLCYSVYNCALYFSVNVQADYFRDHPFGVNPVQTNDVVFSLHALAATSFTIAQCCFYERGAQRISWVCICFLIGAYGFIGISSVLGGTGVISWLAYVEYLSAVKLAVTLIKYTPQLYLNFRRRSTQGWSIWNVLLDFTGGTFSLFQMFLIAYNFDDWSELFGDFTKFGLGAISLIFDVLFIIQHYVLYPETVPYEHHVDDDLSPDVLPPSMATPMRNNNDILGDNNSYYGGPPSAPSSGLGRMRTDSGLFFPEGGNVAAISEEDLVSLADGVVDSDSSGLEALPRVSSPGARPGADD